MKHTPTPWKTGSPREFAGVKWDLVISNASNDPIASCNLAGWDSKTGLANAAFIVQAVNAHDKLVEALQAMMLAWELTRDGHALAQRQSGHAIKLSFDALALAKGEK